MKRKQMCFPAGVQWILGVLLVLGAGLPCAEGRVFTNKKGRSIEAEMIGASSTHVRLKKDGRVFNVPIDTLSEADQAYIRQETAAVRSRLMLQQRLDAIRNRNAPGSAKPDPAEEPDAEPGFDETNTDFVGGLGKGGEEKSVQPEKVEAAAKPEKPDAPPAEPKPPAKKAPPKKKPVRDPNNPGVPGKVVTEKFELKKDVEVRYYIYLPKEFRRGSKPPVMFLLASGHHHQRGYIDQYLKGVEQNGFVLVMPMYEREPKLEIVETDRAVAEEVIRKLGVDNNRIYMTGLSSAADRALKSTTEYPDLDVAGILSCDAGLSQTKAKLDKKTVLYATCGAGSKRRYDLGHTFDSLLKGKDHRLRFFMGSNTWPTEELITEGITWLNICFLRKVSPRDAALVAERKALAAKLLAQVQEEKETAPDRAYEKALMLQELSAEPAVGRVMAPLMKGLAQKPEVKLYIEAMKELDRFVGKYFGDDPRKVDMKKEDRSAKRAAERLAEKYKDTSLAPILGRVGELPL